MSEQDEITVFGDQDKCDVCKKIDGDFSKKIGRSKKIKYTYKPLDDTESQKFLESRGIKDQDHVDVPIIRVCKTREEDGKKKKYCHVESGYEESKWKDLDNDMIPDTLAFKLEEE